MLLTGLEPVPSSDQFLRLACLPIPPQEHNWWVGVDSNYRTRRNRFTVCRVWPLRYPPIFNGVPSEARTPDTGLRRAMLYPTELRGHWSARFDLHKQESYSCTRCEHSIIQRNVILRTKQAYYLHPTPRGAARYYSHTRR